MKRLIAKKVTFINPFQFMNWLIKYKVKDPIHKSGNNNYNPIQSIDDILISHEANCVDIAIAVYKIVKSSKDCSKPTIVKVDWQLNENHSEGHIFTLFIYNDNIYVFDYDQIHQKGEMLSFTQDKSYDEIIKKCCNNMRKQHPNKLIRDNKAVQIINILNKNQLKLIDKKWKTQKEFLEALENYL